MLILPTRADADRYARTYTLDDVTIRLHFWWWPASGAWYVDLDDSLGVRLLSGQRVTPSAPLWPDRTMPGLPPGVVIVDGPDPYAKEQLGSAVRLLYVTAAELAAL